MRWVAVAFLGLLAGCGEVGSSSDATPGLDVSPAADVAPADTADTGPDMIVVDATPASMCEADGITPAMMGPFLDALYPCTFYTWRGQKVMVTHGGLSTVPLRPELISDRQYVRGTGDYAAPVDRQFDVQAPAGWVQIHGHRNVAQLPIHAAPRSYNLVGRVEFGGALRVVVLDEGGFHPIEV